MMTDYLGKNQWAVRHQRLSYFLRIVTDLLILLNLIALVTLPLILTAIYRNPALLIQLEPTTSITGPDVSLQPVYPSDLPMASYPFYLGFLYVAGLGTAIILIQGHRILRRIERSEPFTAGQGPSFRIMAISFFGLAITFLVKIFTYNTLLTMFCSLLFVILGVVSLILADVFHLAWQVKTENELTI